MKLWWFGDERFLVRKVPFKIYFYTSCSAKRTRRSTHSTIEWPDTSTSGFGPYFAQRWLGHYYQELRLSKSVFPQYYPLFRYVSALRCADAGRWCSGPSVRGPCWIGTTRVWHITSLGQLAHKPQLLDRSQSQVFASRTRFSWPGLWPAPRPSSSLPSAPRLSPSSLSPPPSPWFLASLCPPPLRPPDPFLSFSPGAAVLAVT